MKRERIVTLIFIVIFFNSLLIPAVYTYERFFSESSYHESHNIVKYDDIFFNPKSKEYNIYNIGGFGYIDISMLSKYPEDIVHYENKEIFDGKTIDTLISLLENCKFIPLERNEAFYINFFKHNKSNDITSLDIDSGWFDDKYNDLFSKKVVDEINEQVFGISECTIFEINNKLYLIGAYTYEIIGGSFIKYEKPNFGKTLTVLYEIEESEETQKIIEMRESFYPDKDDVYSVPTVNRTILVCELVVYIVLMIVIYIKKKRRNNQTNY